MANTLLNGNSNVAVKASAGMFYVNPEDIIRMEAKSNYTYIYFTNRKPLLMAKTLGDYEQQLCGSGFLRIHRSHLVNLRHVVHIDAIGNIVMHDTSRPEVSRRKKKIVLQSVA